MLRFLSKIFNDANNSYLHHTRGIVEKINALEPVFEKLSNTELKIKTEEFKKLIAGGRSLDTALVEAFALVREAAKRALKQRHFDVQLIGGIVLHEGKIAEMRTGEGKTLTATLPAYLNALSGRSAHIITVNDYLARRDAVWMGQIYHALGLTVGCVNPNDQSYIYDPNYINLGNQMPDSTKQSAELDQLRDTAGYYKVFADFLRPVSKRQAYACDIVYGTNTEFGFDYLRDNLVQRTEEVLSPRRAYAIVDEVDSILIDEARTPLIISVPDAESPKLYETFARIVPRLKENDDYNIDEKMRTVIITESGLDKVEKMLGIGNIYTERGIKYVHHLEQALRAHALFHKDKDYVVKNGQVIIVDEFTGRLLNGRRYSEGLHQAIEAKEGVKVEQESRTLATITFQNFFRLYEKLAGMTGTAATSAEEFHKVYNLGVVVVPTHKTMIRQDLPDWIYKSGEAKFKAVVKEIKERHQKGQPMLIGTISIGNNERLSRHLTREGIGHEVLNAKQHEREGAIIAQAGKLGAVTIATNMAGRGVDIIPGGNLEDSEQRRKVLEAGGLHVIGTERHEARRIDNQLRGRSGRQGDPGSSQFFVSLEDHLMRVFGGSRIKSLMETLNIPEDQPIEHGLISKAIESAQSKIEGFNFDARKHLLDYDDVMNRQRMTIYKRRFEILSGNFSENVFEILKKQIESIIDFHISQDQSWSEWSREEIFENLKASLPIEAREKEFLAAAKTAAEVKNHFIDLAEERWRDKEKLFGPRVMKEMEKVIMLNVLDNLWMNHLEDMEYLRDSVRLRAYGQRDPLVEYKHEAHRLFNQLLQNFEFEVAMMAFKVEPQAINFVGAPVEQSTKSEASDSEQAGEQIQNLNDKNLGQFENQKIENSRSKIGRNDPCPCGSGKKYKRCHGK